MPSTYVTFTRGNEQDEGCGFICIYNFENYLHVLYIILLNNVYSLYLRTLLFIVSLEVI